MMMKKIKILFLLPNLNGGGAQRVLSIIIKYLNTEKYDINLALIKKEGEFLSDIPSSVNIINLNVSRSRYALFKMVKLIYSLKPNFVFSTLGYLNLLISLIRPILPKNIQFIARESNTVSSQNSKEYFPWLYNFLYKRLYNNFELIVAQSVFMKKDLVDNFSIDEGKIKVIYNPIDIDNIQKKSVLTTNNLSVSKDKVKLLAVGRISYQKGYDLLLKAMMELDDQFVLTILGEGVDTKKIADLSKQYKLEDRVHFAGFSSNPYEYMANADLLVLSSRYEGLPNVVLEANSIGLPVVAFNCPGGTAEVIEEGINGLLVDCGNTEKFAEAVTAAADIDFDRDIIKKRIDDNFSRKHIIPQYEKLFSGD